MSPLTLARRILFSMALLSMTTAAARAAPPRRVAIDTHGPARLLPDTPPEVSKTSWNKGRLAAPVIPSWRVAHPRARSEQKPYHGWLAGGQPLPLKGTGFRRLARPAHFGTDETIALIRYAGARLEAAFPGSVPMLVGDISRHRGGRMERHLSHQSGRDVDIAYLEKHNHFEPQFNGRLRARQIDFVKSWFVMETLIATNQVLYIFVDHSLIPHFEAEARAQGWSAKALAKLFPPTPWTHAGIVRNCPGHTYHFHVRFKCPPPDHRCRN